MDRREPVRVRVDCGGDRVLGQTRHRRADFVQIGAPGQVAQQDVKVHALAQPAQGNSQGRGIGFTDEPVKLAVGPLERLVEHRLDGGAKAGVGDAKALRIAAELVRSSEVHRGIQRGGRPFPY